MNFDILTPPGEKQQDDAFKHPPDDNRQHSHRRVLNGGLKPYQSRALQHRMPGSTIAKKIGCGYIVAIGIGIVGTTVGLAIGDSSQRQAKHQFEVAHQKQELLQSLENATLKMRSHPQRSIEVLEQSIWFEYEKAKFLSDVERIHQIIRELQQIKSPLIGDFSEDATDSDRLLKEYEAATESYTQFIQSIWQTVQPASLTPDRVPAAVQQVFSLTRSDRATKLTVQFDRLFEGLNRLLSEAETQETIATKQLDRAEKLRVQIIAISMLLSAAIAILLGHYTSRAIARPIAAVSDIAQQVTHTANFQLVAPVLTRDEVGALAISLNQMVQWMGQYTRELEGARQTLEQRVEERTQELSHALNELKQAQTQLIQSEKMSSLGRMVAGLAHEINNPANFIHGNVQHAVDYMEDLLELVHLYQAEYPQPNPAIESQIEAIELEFLEEDLPKVLASMKMGTDRIRQIILSLRNFSRLDESQLKAVDIHEGIDNTLLILNSRLKKDVKAIAKYGNIPLVECYPAQLNQVFMNVISNAIDALEEYPIATQKEIIIQTELQDDRTVCVRIVDNGPGMKPEVKSKLFDPFFTTKPVGKGTGLGLAIAYQIVAKHAGTIQVFSEPGKGTEFAIALPICPPQKIAAPDSASSSDPHPLKNY